MKIKHFTALAILLILILAACSPINIVKIEEQIVFPETEHVSILSEKPDSAHVVIALMEVNGGTEKSILSALNDMEKSARKLGADALIARMIRLNKIETDKPFKLRGTAIKYASSIQKLTRDNVRLVYPNRPFSIGGRFNIIPLISGGYGGAAWIGRKNIRLRAETFKCNTPNSFWKDGFNGGKIESSWNFYLDYFINHPNSGVFLFGGAGFTSGSVTHKNETGRGSHKNSTLSFGIGYNHPINNFINISTDITGHIIIDGSRAFSVGNHPVILSPVFPSLSLNVELYW